MQHGILLINLGTPKSSQVSAVRSYLREFLMDKRVIDLPVAIRYALVYGLIIPFRSPKTAHAYSMIWTKKGSPLLVHGQQLCETLQQTLGANYKVALAMRYGEPSITTGLAQLRECATLSILPLYPQYSSAATGSSIEEVMRLLSQQEVLPSATIIREFYQHPAYINAQAQLIKRHLPQNSFLLLSYHGIPERQIVKSGCSRVCDNQCPNIGIQNQHCYRAQCYQTSKLLAHALDLSNRQYATAFQSRLGKTPWIKPYTDELLIELRAKNISHLAVACPSFVADCLETLEEIGMRCKEQWLQMGGTEFTLIPCLNSENEWINALAEIACPNALR